MPSLFGQVKPKKNNANRLRPTESAQVNETTIVDLFVTEQGPRWGLSRVNENESGRSFRTMLPTQLADATEAIGFLAGIFSQDPSCSALLKSELSALSSALEHVVEKAKNGFREVNGETPKTGLLAANAG